MSKVRQVKVKEDQAQEQPKAAELVKKPLGQHQEPLLEQDARLKRPVQSRRTGGPRTSEGRARSSLNAIKHGGYVTAKSASVDLLALKDELIMRLNPHGPTEVSLVESIALELFRLSMLGKLEFERLQAVLSSEVNLLALAQALSFPWGKTHLEVLRSPPRLPALQQRVAKFFRQQLSALESQPGHDLAESGQELASALREAIEDLLDEEFSQDHEPDYLDLLDQHMRSLGTSHELLSESMALPIELQHLVDYWLFRNYYRIESTRRELQVEQVTHILTSPQVGRARDQAHKHIQLCTGMLETLQAKTTEPNKVQAHVQPLARPYLLSARNNSIKSNMKSLTKHKKRAR